MEEFVTIKAHKETREDLKVIAALTKEKQQDALRRIIAEEKARVLKEAKS